MLPYQLSEFVGRTRELGELADLLFATRLLTLTGVGGVGKTRLALELAYRCLERFPDGTNFVSLAVLREVLSRVVERAMIRQPSEPPRWRSRARL